MQIELNKEEWEFFSGLCKRARFFTELNILTNPPFDDVKKIDALIAKLGKEWKPSEEE